MGPIDIVIIVLVSLAVIGVAGSLIYRKIKHKGSGCGCDCCGGCSGCSSCSKPDKDK